MNKITEYNFYSNCTIKNIRKTHVHMMCWCYSIKTCMEICDAQQGCVAVGHIKRKCYICNNESNDGSFVPYALQLRYFMWHEHLLEIEGISNVNFFLDKSPGDLRNSYLQKIINAIRSITMNVL